MGRFDATSSRSTAAASSASTWERPLKTERVIRRRDGALHRRGVRARRGGRTTIGPRRSKNVCSADGGLPLSPPDRHRRRLSTARWAASSTEPGLRRSARDRLRLLHGRLLRPRQVRRRLDAYELTEGAEQALRSVSTGGEGFGSAPTRAIFEQALNAQALRARGCPTSAGGARPRGADDAHRRGRRPAATASARGSSSRTSGAAGSGGRAS